MLTVEVSSANQQQVLWSSIKPQKVTCEVKPVVKKVRKGPAKSISREFISYEGQVMT